MNDLPKRIIIYRYSEEKDYILAAFPELPANNVASSMLTFSFRFGWLGVDEDWLRSDTESIKEHPDTPEINRHVRLLDQELSRSYDLQRFKRLLRRFKIVRYTTLHATDKERSKELKTSTKHYGKH